MAQKNDNCKDAIVILVDKQCNSQTFSNLNTTAEPDSIAPSPSCGSFAGGDVWFKLKMPGTGTLRIEVDNLNGATPPSYTLYAGSCGDLTEVSCNRLNPDKTISDPTLAGDTLYLRVYSYFTSTGTSFSLCLFEPDVPANDFCENAIQLPVFSQCKLDTFSNAYATDQHVNIAAIPSCGFYKGGDIWFKTTMPASGTIRISKNRISGATNPAMTIYSGTCGNLKEVFCSANDPSESFDNSSLAGKSIYLRLFSFNQEEGSSFSLCLFDYSVPVNDNCENAIGVVVDSVCTPLTFTTFLATTQPTAIAADPTCGLYKGSDVWFKLAMSPTGNLTLASQSLTGSLPPSFTIYSGSCGNFREEVCLNNTRNYTFTNSLVASDTVYLRFYPLNSDDGFPFTFCAYAAKIAQGKVDTAVFRDQGILTASAENASYQWLDCNNGYQPLPGETKRSLNINENGFYAVEVTQWGLTDTSFCHSLTVLAGKDELFPGLSIYPNPVVNLVTLQLDHRYQSVRLEVINLNQQVVNQSEYHRQDKIEVNIAKLPAGVYFVRVSGHNLQHTFKIIKL